MRRVLRIAVLVLLAVQVFSCASGAGERARLEQERLEQERLEQERLEQERLEQERIENERERVAWLSTKSETALKEAEQLSMYAKEFVESKYTKASNGKFYDKKAFGDAINRISSYYSAVRSENPYGYESGKWYCISLGSGRVNQWLNSQSALYYLAGLQLAYLHWDGSSLTKKFDGVDHDDCLLVCEGTYEYETVSGSTKIVPKFKMIETDYKTEDEVNIEALESYEKTKRTLFPKQFLSGFVLVEGNGEIDSFHIDEGEVTQVLYETVMGENPSKFKGAANPVESISWYDAVKFCNVLSAASGLECCYTINGKYVTCDFSKNGYRLPTEDEWAWAAKGGIKSNGYAYSGSNYVDEVAWYSGNSGHRSHPVKTRKPNELGIYDMSGNVMEWCWDGYSSYRVVRGGRWYGSAGGCSVSNRHGNDPSCADGYLGFRLVRSARD